MQNNMTVGNNEGQENKVPENAAFILNSLLPSGPQKLFDSETKVCLLLK